MLFRSGPVGGGWRAGVRLPWWRRGGTGLDALPGWWHERLGLADGGRDLYPEGESLVVLDGGGRAASRRGRAEGPGRVEVWLGRELDAGAAVAHRLWLSAGPPASGGPGLGNRGWSAGLRWGMRRTTERGRLDLGLGATWQEGPGRLVPSSDLTWHGWLGYGRRLTRRLGAGAVIRVDGSPVDDRLDGRPGEATVEASIGPTFDVGGGVILQLALGEDLPDVGLAPDFSVQLRLLTSGPPW